MNGYLLHIVLNAVVVIGLIAWARKLLAKLKVQPQDWAYVAASAALSFLVAGAMLSLPLWVRMGLLTLAVTQLAYANVVKLLQRLVDKLGPSES